VTMTTPAHLPTAAGEPGDGTTASSASSAEEAVVPSGHDMPLSVSLLVFARDRGIFVLWGLLIAVFAFWCSPYFFKLDNAILIANAGALTALFAAGVGIGIMTGVLDLSLPGTAAIASCVCGWLLTHGHATWLSLLAGLGCGVVVGLVNGFITLRGFNPIIVTIGTLSVLTGLAAVVAGGYTFPGLTQLEFMGTHRYFRVGDAGQTFSGIPAPVFIVAAVFLVGTIFLTRTRDGLRLMAVGANAEAVRRAGIPANRYKVLGFVISGLLAAVGGLVNTANVTEANPAASPAIIFTALTAVALAGVALTGGRGSLPRVLVGAMILATIANGLTIRGIQPYWATVCTGALLLGSLALERAIQSSVSERLMAANLSVHQKKV
jgi:ribose/xylose/arabinose/galactoside ABC-type transport system permease subunit